MTGEGLDSEAERGTYNVRDRRRVDSGEPLSEGEVVADEGQGS